MNDPLITVTPQEHIERFMWGVTAHHRRHRDNAKVASTLYRWAERRLSRMRDLVHSQPRVNFVYLADQRAHVAYLYYAVAPLPEGRGRFLIPETPRTNWVTDTYV